MFRCPHALCRSLSLYALLSWLLIGTASAASPLRVDSSSQGSLRLTVTPGALTWSGHPYHDDSVVLHVPAVEGFVLTGMPGQPQVPVASRWLVVPPGTRAELKVVEAVWRELEPRRIAPTPTPVFRNSDDPEQPYLGGEVVLPGDKARSGEALFSDRELASLSAELPSEAFHLGEAALWRGHRIAALAVRPLDVDATGRARRVLDHATLEVLFIPDGSQGKSPGAGRGDRRFGSLLLNGELLESLPAEPTAVRPSAGPIKSRDKRGTLLQPEVRIPVTKTRMYRLEAAGLAAAGLLDLDGVAESQVRLYQRRATPDGPGLYEEIEVPILLNGDGGDFAGDDEIVFWGLRARDDGAFSDEDGAHAANADQDEQYSPSVVVAANGGNIYYLAVSEPEAGESWARMGTTSLTPATGTPLASYRRNDYFEEDTHHAYAPASTFEDRYRWNAVRAAEARKTLSVKSPVPGRSDARLKAGVYGLGDTPRDYRFDLVSDGTPHLLGTILDITDIGYEFDTATSGSLVQSDWLLDAEFIVANMSSTINFMLGYLDWFELDYEAAYAAVDDALDFHLGEAAGVVDVEVTGFSDPDIHLFDLTDPRRPLVCELSAGNVVAGSGESWTLSIQGSQDGPRGRRFQSLAGDLSTGVPAFQYFRATVVGIDDDPTAANGTPDVLVVTHAEFREQAERWVQYRSARGPESYDFHIVDVDQLYGWFSGGMKHPDAIKAMVEYASENWGTWALQIFGDAYQNTRSLSDSSGRRDWVPSHWHVWDYSRYANALLPSDNWFVNPGSGADYPDDTWLPPEMIVARFPCNTPAEASTMIDKVITFEAADGAWKQRALFISDDAWSNGYQSQGSDHYYNSYEEEFELNSGAQATAWETLGCGVTDWCADLGLGASRLFIGDDLDPISPVPPREAAEFQDHCQRLVLPQLLAQVAQGALFVQYQGHANEYTLADERLIMDSANHNRRDLAEFNNTGRPFVFVGLGCHIATWARDTVEYPIIGGYPSLSEKLLLKANSGAVATYASPGFEFLHTNSRFSSTISQVWLGSPPRGGAENRSRWMLGELFMATETAMLAGGADQLSRRLVAQFALLGDGLMTLDAGAPRTRMSLGWDVIPDGTEVKAADESNELVVTIEAFDEAGVDRLAVRDLDGADIAATVTGGTPPEATDDQYATWEVRLPFTPADRTVVFHVYDTADVSDAAPHATVSIVMSSTVVLYLDGQQFVAGVTPLPGGEPVPMTGRLVTSSWVAADAALELTPDDVILTDVVLTRTDEHTLDMAFTVEVTGTAPKVTLLIDGQPVVIPLSDSSTAVTGISDVNIFPNPVSDEARFVFRTDAGLANGSIHLYSLAGHRIASLPVRTTDFQGGGAVIVDWNGRDEMGDRPANGVYLYRVELETSAGRLASGMQRLVIMR